MRLALLAWIAGCGSANPSGAYRPAGPRARRIAVVPEDHRPPADLAPLYDAAVRGGTRSGFTLHSDAILERVAAELLPTVGEGADPPPVTVVEFAIRWHGLADPAPMVLLTAGPDVPSIAGAVEGLVADSGTLPYNRVGVAVAPIPGGFRSLVLVSMRWAEVEPVDLQVAPGSTLRLAARILPPFQRPRIAVTSPDDTVTEIPLADAREFVAQIPLPRAGRYDVEILGEAERGIMVLANFPVWAGANPPSAPDVEPPPPPDTDSADVEARLFSLLDAARAKQHLPALERRGDLDRVARAHSADMVKNRFVGHRSPTTGEPSDRLRKAGVVSGLVLENIGRDYSAKALHDGLMRSPGHRANILQADATHIGVGVVAEPEGNRTAFVATQVYIQLARVIDATDAESAFGRILNERRGRVGAPPVEVDRELSNVSRTGAQRLFRQRMSQADVTAGVQEELEPFGLAYRRIGVIVTVVTDVEQAATIERLLERDMTVVGVGIAQGDHPEFGSNAIAVVVVMAWPR